MNLTPVFHKLVSETLAPWFRERGFSFRGRRFVRWVGGNCQVIGFRRPRRGDVESLEVLADLGILSGRIWNFYVRTRQWLPFDGKLPRFPDPADCHWRTSIHEPRLVPAYANRPWVIHDPSDVPAAAQDIVRVLTDHALPALDRYVSDEALRDHWLKTPLFATSEVQHLSYLGALVSGLGPKSELPQIIQRLQLLEYNRPAVDAMVAELQSAIAIGQGTQQT